jgi:ABC-2 type transport system permease protein
MNTVTPLVIGGVELRRFLRDRSNIFFVFIFPLALVLLIGAQFGGDGMVGRAVVVGDTSDLRSAVLRTLEANDLEVETADRDTALEKVARSRADVAVVVDAEAADDHKAGDPVRLTVVPSSDIGAQTAVQQVQLALQELSTEQGQQAALVARGVPAAEAGSALAETRDLLSAPRLEVDSVGELAEEFEGLGQFDFGASGQLLVFVFLASLTGATTLIQARKLGVVSRTLAAPVTTTQLLLGQALGRFAIAVFQGGYIMAATALLFDVDWGNLALSLLVLALFGLVSAGAAMLIGALLDNEGAAAGLGVGIGLVVAALGGAMMPLELFPDTMATVARATPHAWAYEAFADIQRHGGGLVDVLPELGVLAAMATVLLVLGSWALRRSLARAL